MANLVIKGHATRGKEIIELFEMLGTNKLGYKDTFADYYYIECEAICSSEECPIDSIVFTLEEFIEKYPYKVGDKVQTIYGKIGIVNKPIWSSIDNCIRYELEADTDSFYFVNELQPYKEENMEEKIDKALSLNLKGEDYSGKRFCYKIPNGYEFDCIKNDEIILKPKQLQYPKTYRECCEVLVGRKPNLNEISFDKMELCLVDSDNTQSIDFQTPQLFNLDDLFRLLMCRNAYWKIAGEAMGLGKPWEPNWSGDTTKYTICYKGYRPELCTSDVYNRILAFPTPEMRDAFYENFKNLIEVCKKLL